MKKLILLLLTFGLIQGELHRLVEIDQPQLRERGPCISEEQRQKLQSDIKNNRELLIANGSIDRISRQERVLFAQPLQASNDYISFGNYIIFNYVNHNPDNPHPLLDWNCGTRTYHDGCDGAYYCSHRGTDYTLWPYWWNMMENNSVEVIAVADGVIIGKTSNWPDDICAANYDYDLPDVLNNSGRNSR